MSLKIDALNKFIARDLPPTSWPLRCVESSSIAGFEPGRLCAPKKSAGCEVSFHLGKIMSILVSTCAFFLLLAGKPLAVFPVLITASEGIHSPCYKEAKGGLASPLL
mmetsp:Transcript_27288/g.71930  ORF Transcript_27288/g.71930 Transcript_27288/m.71930 type:complete len:107 (-) Transcript_27288:372-692(-)